jgi:hypothetical protein
MAAFGQKRPLAKLDISHKGEKNTHFLRGEVKACPSASFVHLSETEWPILFHARPKMKKATPKDGLY